MYNSFFRGATHGSAQGLLLALCSRITSGGTGGAYVTLEIEPGLVVFKATPTLYTIAPAAQMWMPSLHLH